LRDIVPQIRAKGAELVVVGSGSPEQARAFRDEQRLDFPLLVDPAREAYAVAGLKRSLGSTLGPGVLVHSIRALRQGYRQGPAAGDLWQQGGVLVIAPDGTERFKHTSARAGDHPDPALFLVALP
jgi:hypothetical protein